MNSLFKQIKWYIGKKTAFLADYKVYKKLRGYPIVDCTINEASEVIKRALVLPQSSLIARIGSNELRVSVISNKKGNYSKNLVHEMQEVAGFYPSNTDTLNDFGKFYLNLYSNIDILASWRKEEKFISNFLAFQYKIDIRHLESFRASNPWTKSLENKKILVINPFIKTIVSQYKKRKLLFNNQNILPDFQLLVYKPVVSHGGASEYIKFASWFEALEFMKEDIKSIDFDIALIGAGAYGLPLGKFIKDLGKKAVVLGGVTQFFFGIKGTRWDDNPVYNKHYNEHWVRPLKEELPPNPNLVEGGAYF